MWKILWSMFGLIVCSSTSFAHPMGNFSINHYSKIKIDQKSIEIRYLIDMAEIPTFQEMRQFDIGPKIDDTHYLDREGQLLKQGIALESDGRPVRLDTISHQITFADGAGGLPTMKIGFVFRGKVDAVEGAHKLNYVDNNFPGRAGWKEIVVLGNGVAVLESSAPGTDRSQELTNYSSDVLNSPPEQLSALVGYNFETPIAPKTKKPSKVREIPNQAPTLLAFPVHARPVAPQPQNTPRSHFTQLISTQGELSFWVLLSAALIAAGLGALHALEPGHGKTIVAAYLVGSRGTARHAVLLGIVVTAAHTAGVYLLGAATLYASRYIVPEQLYPWLGAISGLSVAGLGVFMLLRHWTGETGEHSHTPGKTHSHWFSAPTERAPAVDRPLSLRELCMLGITGGIVPCPAALVVLLSAFSLHRIGFGLFLITAFSFGLAAVLVIVGLTMVFAKRALSSRVSNRSPALRYLPFLSSAFMVVLGVGIAASALAPVHIGPSVLSTDKLLPFVTVILLGLFLGMRHSTDPDHVVAVSTIVSRQGSIRSSAAIGLLWGLGHTLTILLVGSAIIIFGVVIPPRLGLSMEFCVALMLILLGVLNLTKKSRPVASFGTIGKLGLYQTIRPLAVGLVHGLAGSAAVSLLVLSTIKSPLWSTAYLLVFGFGTMAGMMFMTAAISMPLVYAGRKFFKINGYLIAISGFASMAFGMFLVYQIGFVDGLFTPHAHWIPQ
jgi:nickel/cobalt exporter